MDILAKKSGGVLHAKTGKKRANTDDDALASPAEATDEELAAARVEADQANVQPYEVAQASPTSMQANEIAAIVAEPSSDWFHQSLPLLLAGLAVSPAILNPGESDAVRAAGGALAAARAAGQVVNASASAASAAKENLKSAIDALGNEPTPEKIAAVEANLKNMAETTAALEAAIAKAKAAVAEANALAPTTDGSASGLSGVSSAIDQGEEVIASNHLVAATVDARLAGIVVEAKAAELASAQDALRAAYERMDAQPTAEQLAAFDAAYARAVTANAALVSAVATAESNTAVAQGLAASAGETIDLSAVAKALTAGADALDNPAPVFASAAAASVLENTTTDVAVYTAVSNQALPVKYAITGGADAALFEINPVSGAVTFKQAPDFEAPNDASADNVYDLIITATDIAGHATAKSVAVTVTDSPTPPVSSFTVDTAPVLNANSVVTGIGAANATVLVTLDPDNDPSTSNSVVYLTTTDANGNFSLNLARALPVSGSMNFLPDMVVGLQIQQVVGNVSGDTVSGTTRTPSVIESFISLSESSILVNEGLGVARFTVTRSGNTAVAASVDFATQGGSAVAGIDFTGQSGTITFAAGEVSKVISIAIIDDDMLEASESFRLLLSNATPGFTLGTSSSEATIVDNDQSIWSINGAAQVSEGVGTVTYTISRTGTTEAASITVSTSGSSAIAGSDYEAIAPTVLNFADGEISKTVVLKVTDDVIKEGNENVIVGLSRATSGSIDKGSVTTTILDNDQSNWSVLALSPEVGEGGGTVQFVVSRTGAMPASTIDFKTGGGAASLGADYTAVSQTLSFAEGEMSKVVTISLADDLLKETAETIVAIIGNPQFGNMAESSATTTVVDNDQISWSIVANQTVVDEATGTMTFTISRTGPAPESTIDFSTGGGSASANADYAGGLQTLTFSAGEMSKVVTVTITDDDMPEALESFNGTISNAQFGTLATSSATVTITDNEQINWRVVADATSVDEGAGSVTFIVTRTGASTAAEIDFSTSGGTAATGTDFTSVSERLVFAEGEMSKRVTVLITDDETKETSETFTATLGNASSGNLMTASATVTIVDNDQINWYLKAQSSDVNEGAGFTTFVISRTGSADAASLDFSTGGGTASLNDYVPVTAQRLDFAAGEMSKTVTVAIAGDTLGEINETFGASISNVSAGNIAAGSAVVNIVDDDQIAWSISAATTLVDETAGQGTFVVSRTGGTDAATIMFSTGGGTASSGLDYTSTSQLLSFAEGEMSKTVSVKISDDLLAEASETFTASLSEASLGNIASGTGTSTITLLDNDQSVWSIAPAAAQVSEKAGTATFIVTRTGGSNATSIDWSVGGGTAAQGADYAAMTGTLAFEQGQMSRTVTVNLTDEVLKEGDETFNAILSNQQSGSLGASVAKVTILDDEQISWAISAPTNVSEGAGVVVFTISRTGDLNVASSIKFSAMGGGQNRGALPGIDFVQDAPITLDFAAGEATKTVSVNLVDNALIDLIDNNLQGVIYEAQSGAIITGTAVTNIVDNDQLRWFVSTASNKQAAEDSGEVSFVVYRTDATSAATVDFTTTGTAVGGVDYVPIYETLSFAVGELSKSVTVRLLDDNQPEASKDIMGILCNPSAGVWISAVASPYDVASSSVTVIDNDTMFWSTAAASTAVSEADGALVFTVTRSSAATEASIQVSTLSGTAVAGQDFVPLSAQTLNFAVGELSKVVQVAILNDAKSELQDSVSLLIHNQSSGATTTNLAVTNIVDDDQMVWSVKPAQSSQYQDESPVQLAALVSRTGKLDAATIEIYLRSTTARPEGDYIYEKQRITFAEGQTSQVVSMAIIDDTVAEAATTYNFVIGNASMGDYERMHYGVEVTRNDETVRTSVGMGISWLTRTPMENDGAGVFRVSRFGDLSGEQTVNYTFSGTAVLGADYQADGGTLNFKDGESFKLVTVRLLDDAVADGAKSLFMNLSNPSGGYLDSVSSNSLSIQDNEAPVTSVTYAVAAAEANVDEGAGEAVFRITRGGNILQESTSYFRTLSTGTATAGADFTAIADQSLNWIVGESVKYVKVPVTDDGTAEGSETIIGQSSANSGFTSAATATATLVDNDSLTGYVLSANLLNASTAAGNLNLDSDWESVDRAVLVQRSGDLSVAGTTYLRTVDGTAIAGTDYVALTKTIEWQAGERNKVIIIETKNDAIAESDETFVVEHSATADFALKSSLTMTMLDDDAQHGSGAFTATSRVAYGSAGDDVMYQSSNVVTSPTASWTVYDLGAGNDTLRMELGRFAGQFIGGEGTDTLQLEATTTYNLATMNTFGASLQGFELINLTTGNQTLNLSLEDVLNATVHNNVANTMRVFTSGGTDTLNLVANGKSYTTPAAGAKVTDVDGSEYTVAQSSSGKAGANDVTIGGKTYDVFLFDHSNVSMTLLVDTNNSLTLNFV